jgi:chaperone required for assembly of F1-ATPase
VSGTGGKAPGDRPSKAAAENPLPRRFYKQATVGARDGAHALLLDGRSARTPGKRPLAVPAAALAAAMAAEWEAQTDRIDPSTMPVTRLVNTVIDGVADQAEAVRAEIVKYAGSDLLCYRADFPADLVARQARAWDPVLAWVHARLGVRFFLAEGVMPVAQRPETLDRIATHIAPLDPYRLGAVHVLMTLSGSAILALALLDGAIGPDEAWAAAHVDEDFQIAQWGEDAEAATRRQRRRTEFDAAVLMLSSLMVS